MDIYDLIFSLGIPASVTTLLFFLLRKYFGSKIDLASKKSLAEHQQKLDLVGESAKLNFQRKIQDFSLYNSKKHEKYIELHKLFLEAQSRLLGLYGLRSRPSFVEYSEDDLRKKMETEGFVSGKIDEVLEIIRTVGRDEGIGKMRKYLRMIEFQKAERSIQQVQNFYWISKLFFSDNIDRKSDELLKIMNELNSYYITYMDTPPTDIQERKDYRENTSVLEKNINELINEIIVSLKEELSVGYYEE